MRLKNICLATALLTLPLCHAAEASGYEISPIGDKGAYIGCIAIEQGTGITFMGFAQKLSVFMTSDLLRINKGDVVDGTWSIDGGKERPLTTKAELKNTVTADLNASRDIVGALADGNQISATVGATYVDFDLGGSKQALQDLGACMDKNVKQ